VTVLQALVDGDDDDIIIIDSGPKAAERVDRTAAKGPRAQKIKADTRANEAYSYPGVSTRSLCGHGCLYVCMSVCLYVRLSVCLFVCL
jgi:hypothetical protein